MGPKLLREQRNSGTINLMSPCENSTSEATETVKMPLTPLTTVQLFQKGGSSAVPFQRMDVWCHLLALHWSWIEDPSPRNERIQGTRGSMKTLKCVLWETGMEAGRTLRVLPWMAQMRITQLVRVHLLKTLCTVQVSQNLSSTQIPSSLFWDPFLRISHLPDGNRPCFSPQHLSRFLMQPS